MTDGTHVLVVTETLWSEDGETGIDREYEIECPGVTDACRAYEDCSASLEEQGMLENGGVALVAHGRRHLFIDSTWMAETDQCRVATFDRLDEAAAATSLSAGCHPVDFDFGDGTELILFPLSEPTQPTENPR